MDEVNLLIQEHDIDILAVSETWLQPSVSKRVLVFPGYHITRCDRTNRPDSRALVRGGGVAILTRDNLRATTLQIGGSSPDLESLWLSISGPGSRTVVVGAMYRPPASSIPGALELIDQQLRDAVSTGKPVIIMGDLNINLLQPTGRVYVDSSRF